MVRDTKLCDFSVGKSASQEGNRGFCDFLKRYLLYLNGLNFQLFLTIRSRGRS